MKNINFGIDLGTTNSGIAKFADGKVTVYKNPVGFAETLPSVVAFRKGRIVIGEKARELMKSASKDVFSSFKRKMGTEHLYRISDSGEEKSPVELSSMILKELLSFIPDEKPQSIVITIPASFDTVQSNATKKAGQMAGFEQVVLLQEPIAACLAYANFQNIEHSEEKNWLVYDFGGGTFDVALVKINERELKIIDHEGNNFLGGVDLDHLVIEHLLVPELEKVLNEQDLFKKIMSKSENKFAKLYYELLYKAEEIKKELSVKEFANSEMEINDGEYYVEFQVSRNDFNRLISGKVEESVNLIKNLLDENQKIPQDIERIILVGGTTYIPYIREQLREIFGISVDSSIDPTTAVMVGAAFFAGTKEEDSSISKAQTVPKEENSATKQNQKDVRLIYEVNTQDEEELVVGMCENFTGFYRIIRKDGGFDTGIMPFSNKFSEFVKVLPKQQNSYKISVLDESQNVVFEKEEVIINHGIYNISGQPLPNDICLEVDDNFGSTFLERIFKRNDILPLTKTIYKTTSKNFNKESDDKLIINILEGRTGTLPASNMSIGYIEIKASQMPMNLLKGMDIELKFSMSESRDLSVSVYISSIDYEIKEVFNPHTKHINKERFQEDIDHTISEIEDILQYVDVDELSNEEILVFSKFKVLKDELFKIKMDLIEVEEDEVTERIFQLDERKRRTLQEYDKMVRFRDVLEEIEEYRRSKSDLEEILDDASPRQLEQFHKIIKEEKIFLESNEKSIIRRKAQELDKLNRDIYFKKDESYGNLYYFYKFRELDDYNNPSRVKKLIETGDKAMENGNFKEVKYVVSEMYNLLKVKPRDPFEDKDGNLGLK